MLLVAGLGNPGAEYAWNRHNVGFMAVDAIAKRYGFDPFRRKRQGLIAEGAIGGRRVLLLKPQTFMNESGRALAEACRFYKIGPENIIVLHDEIDLEEGRIKVKQSGGHAGHNGLRSINDHIGQGYKRLRLGVGHPGHKDKVVNHVLEDFSKADEKWLAPLLCAVAEHFEALLQGDAAGFANLVALDLKPPKKNKKPTAKEPQNDGL